MRRKNLILMALVPALGLAALTREAAACTVVIVNASDIDGDARVDITDLLIQLGCWGPNLTPGCESSNLVDLVDCDNPNSDSVNEVDVHDLLRLLSDWTG